MKKRLHQGSMIPIILMTMLFFMACGNAGEPQISDEPLPVENDDDQLPFHAQLTTEDFIHDFDFMMQTMEDTFPYFGVAERILGVDIRALGRKTRDIIMDYPYSLESFANELGIPLDDMPDMDEHVFGSIVYHEFFAPFAPFAHAFALDHRAYTVFQPAYATPASPFYTPGNHHAFTNPVSQRFYQEQEALFHALAEEKGALHQFIFREGPLTASPPRLVTTEITEEGRIAYLSVSSFFQFDFNTISSLNRFYREIQDYEHLIIDIRNNTGGSVEFWRMFIMRPLWPEGKDMPDMPLYAFYRGSYMGKSLGEENNKIQAGYSRYKPETDDLLTVDEILESEDLPHFNQQDLEELAYGVRYGTSIGNIEDRYVRQLGFTPSAYPFEGKIWLLTNGYNSSAAALFARHAKEMGFATLVGEPTGGAYTTSGGVHVTLPKTGMVVRWDIDYVTDKAGRALNEFPTTPHHLNRPGMDALETVMQLIGGLHRDGGNVTLYSRTSDELPAKK